MEETLVSVITPTYNSESFIRRTFSSVKSQTLKDWEWIVVDDCSSDGTIKVLKKIEEIDPRVKVSRNGQNMGAAYSRNRGLELAKGNLIAFLDSDDLWVIDKLGIQVDFMSRNNIEFSFTGFKLIDENGEDMEKKIDCNEYNVFGYEDMLLKKATLGCSTVMLSQKLASQQRFPNIRAGQDYAFWLKILQKGHEAHLIPKPLTHYRVRRGSLSRNKVFKARQQWMIYRDIEGLGLIDSGRYFLSYAKNAIFR